MQVTIRMAVVVLGSMVASPGFAQAPFPDKPKTVCEEYNGPNNAVLMGRVVDHETVLVDPPPFNYCDLPSPPVTLRVDAVVVAVTESFRGGYSGKVMITPEPKRVGCGPWRPGVFDPPLETGQSYVFYANFPWYNHDYLTARRVVPANSALISELQLRSRMAGANIYGKIFGIPILHFDSATFLGRVMELRHDSFPRARLESAKVAVVEPFVGITAKETLIFAPFSSIANDSIYLFDFNPPLEVGDTYLFAAVKSAAPEGASLLRNESADSKTASPGGIQGPQLVSYLILPERLAPLEKLRRHRRPNASDTGDAKVIAIEKASGRRFEAHVVATPGPQYRFDDLPPGDYSLAVETEGMVFIGVGPEVNTDPFTNRFYWSAYVRAGGCAVVDLGSPGYFRAPVADCRSGRKQLPLCEKFADAQAVFQIEIPPLLLGQPGR